MIFMKIEKTMIQRRKGVLIVFDHMIADMEFFLRGRNSVFFMSQSYFKVPKTIRLNAASYHENL